MMRVAALLLVAGCTSTGALELQLQLPEDPNLRPAGMTTVSVITTSPGREPIANTSAFGDTFSAGDLPVGDEIQVAVELRDGSNRLVGVGQAADLIDVTGEAITTLVIPVRRPFVYAASDSALYSFDPTLDPADPKFQGQLQAVRSPRAVASLGTDRLVVAGDGQVQVIATTSNEVTSLAAVPLGVLDIAALPGLREVAIAHQTGISIVDVETGIVTEAAVGMPVDHVVASTHPDGRTIVYGLVGRVAPAPSQIVACGGTSSLVAFARDDPATVVMKPLGSSTSAIAAAPGRLFAARPCEGKVVEIAGDALGSDNVIETDLALLAGAAALAVQSDRLIAVGTVPSVLVCSGGGGAINVCTPAASDACPPPTSGARVAYTVEGAQLSLLTIPLAGGPATTIVLPEQREAFKSGDDPSEQLTQNLRPIGTVPLDLVALPDDNSVAVVTRNSYSIEKLSDGFQDILPCLQAVANDWRIVDLSRAATVSRVRSSCSLTVGPNALFNNWNCGDLSSSETSTVGNYAPISVGALLGAR